MFLVKMIRFNFRCILRGIKSARKATEKSSVTNLRIDASLLPGNGYGNRFRK